VKLIAILLTSLFLHSGIAHALADCFGSADGLHEPTHHLDIGGAANLSDVQDEEPAIIHCANPQLRVGPMLQPNAAPLSKRNSAKFWLCVSDDSAAHARFEPNMAPTKIFLLASISPQFHTPVYIAVSVLRI
jgi:hypothetical protein